MSQKKSPSPAPSATDVPTIEAERRFLAQCEYINRNINAVGSMIRKVLHQRGWRSCWSPEDQDLLYIKDFTDGRTEYLGEYEAYWFEEDHAREFFRRAGIAVKPRKNQNPPPPPTTPA